MIALSRSLTTTAAVLLISSPAVQAAPLPNPDQTINYAVIDQDLRDVLIGIAAQLRLRAEISPHVLGRVHGRLPPATARTMLDRLATLYGFDWYCEDRTLFVSSYEEAVSKVLPLGAVSPNTLMQTLRQLGISDDRWPLHLTSSPEVVAVSGPPEYAALVDQTLTALAQSVKTNVAEVHVFRGTAAGP